MKRLEEILTAIRSLPEEGRKLLAGISLIISALLIFGIWNAHLSYRLENTPSGGTVAEKEVRPEIKKHTNSETFGPVKGLKESFRSLGRNLPSVEVKKNIDQALNSLAGIIFN